MPVLRSPAPAAWVWRAVTRFPSGALHKAHPQGVRAFVSTRRSLGWWDSIKDQWKGSQGQAMEQKQGEVFRDQVSFLLKCERYSLADYTRSLKEAADKAGMDGWRKHMPGVKTNEQVLEFKRHLKILENIPEALLLNPGKIKAAEKARVARAAEVPVQDVNGVLKKYDEAKMLHAWLHKRAAMGKPVPQSPQDIMKMAMEPDSGFSRKFKT